MLPERISLSLSRHACLSSIAPDRSSRQLPVSVQSCREVSVQNCVKSSTRINHFSVHPYFYGSVLYVFLV